jgi:ABC-type dipeptide/oligopeptide/nickel transport system permease subunit
MLREVAGNAQGVAAIVTVLSMVLIGVAAPVLTPYGPLEMHMAERFAPPSPEYWLGADEFGRDIFSRLIYGARVSLLAGLVAVSAATVVGVPLGLLAGYYAGPLDAIIMRAIDFLLAVPGIILAMVIVAILGPNAINAMVAVAIIGIPVKARLVRASTLAEKARDYVDAARCIGATDSRIMFRTILPNTVTPIVVQVALSAAGAVLLEASLSFLGLGTQPPAPSWGTLLNTGRAYMFNSPWYGLFPGLLITLLVLSLNNIADVARDVLDPGSRRRRAAR